MSCFWRLAMLVFLAGAVFAEQATPASQAEKRFPVDLKGAAVGRWTMDLEAEAVDAFVEGMPAEKAAEYRALVKAQAELEDWILSRPANEMAQRARFGEMPGKFEGICARIAELK